MRTVNISGREILVDGQPVKLISGAIHYFRIVPELWEDRLLKARACGLNAIETYIAWNIHEPVKGQFDFSGIADLEKFINLAGKMGFLVILRPSPYICAEWEFGGFPAWLLNLSGIRLRCWNEPYLNAIRDYFDELLPRLKKLQYTEGGPVVMLQIENEYGSFGNDKRYLQFFADEYQRHGINIPLFTSDGPTDQMLQGGTLPDVLKTVNFGSRPEESFDKLAEYQQDRPVMCMEFWNGWFDHWQKPHHTRNATDAADCLDRMLHADAHVNMYMFHGGTNFGFMNGANANTLPEYAPTVTSYDYDAPLSECGDVTPKFLAFREVIAKYRPEVREIPVPANPRKKNYGRIEFNAKAALFDNLDNVGTRHECADTATMETLGQAYGYILYRRQLKSCEKQFDLTIQEPRDRAQVMIDGKEVAVFYRTDTRPTIQLSTPGDSVRLDILVENLGRHNYGPVIEDNRKGISFGVKVNYQYQFGWEIYTLPMDHLDNLRFQPVDNMSGPAFFRAEFETDDPCDTFLKIAGDKGVCWINGFNIGRYWSAGPQRTLYVPAPLLRRGKNNIIVFEQHNLLESSIILQDFPELG